MYVCVLVCICGFICFFVCLYVYMCVCVFLHLPCWPVSMVPRGYELEVGRGEVYSGDCAEGAVDGEG